MGDFFSGVWSWFSGSSVSSAIAKTALVGYVSRLLSDNTNPASGTTPAADPGVRLQLNPSTENQIPVLYGSAYFGGNITDAVLSSDYKKMTYCLTLCEITGELLSTGQLSGYTFNGVYFNNNRVVFKSDGITVDYTLDSSGTQDTSMRDLVKVYLYGNQTGIHPTGYAGTTPAPYTVMPGWTQAGWPMDSLIYAIIEVNYNKDKNVSGLPDCTFHITNSMNLVGDCLVDYMTNTIYGAGIAVTDIDSSFIDLNTYCSSGFTYTDGYNQTQSGIIAANGLIDTTQQVLSNMEELAKAASSWISYDIHIGKWIVVINKAGTSVASFTDGNIVGDIAISGTSLTQLSNVADVKYQNTDILDKSDFVKISIPTGSLYQNEPRSTVNISLPFTNKQSVATKLGLQALKQARVDKIISFKSDYSYINLRAGDLIDITCSILGYTNKVFRIITATEIEGDAGDIQVEFKALEYDASVYTYSITEYLVETDNGILSIGAIGQPDVPTVTKTEAANVPKIVINAVVPSGIVDVMEFWITFDTAVSNDANRTYVKIGQFSNTDGTNLSENAAVSYTYSGLSQSDFFVKVRGANNVATGPYSSPSGLIAYVPVVVADTLSNNPVSINGQLMSLGLLTLLNNLDKLFTGDASTGSIFDKIMGVFKDQTGVDLKGKASDGSLVVASSLSIKEEGTAVTTTTSSINFTGEAVTATTTGNDVTVAITGVTPGASGGSIGSQVGGSSNGDSGVCYNGYLAVGTTSIPNKPVPTILVTCGSNLKWTISPDGKTGHGGTDTGQASFTSTNIDASTIKVTSITSGTLTPYMTVYYSNGTTTANELLGLSTNWWNATGTAFTYQSLTLKNASGTTLGTVTAGLATGGILSFTSLNGLTPVAGYTLYAGATLKATLTSVRTDYWITSTSLASGSWLGSISGTFRGPVNFKPLFIKTNNSTDGLYELYVYTGGGVKTNSSLTWYIGQYDGNSPYLYQPESIDWLFKSSNPANYGSVTASSFTIVGSFNCINQILQASPGFGWASTYAGNQGPIPLLYGEDKTLNYRITPTGHSPITFTQTIQYVPYSQFDAF